ncbi:MAG: hypothetical protein IJP17_03975 [Clostridia bacterium]|nr:hypothetical protein [Clostridia bacterium]
MNNRTKDIAVTLSFAAFIAFFVVMCAIRFFSPVSVSESERRPLAGPPQNVTWESIIDKSSIDKFEDFTVDQFPFREFFRSVKAHISRDILRLRENNSLAIEDGYIVKIESDFSDELVDYSLGRLMYIDEKYLSQSGDKFVSVVPDKNYFLGRDYGYPSPDYEGLVDDVRAALPDMTYVDIFGALSLDDYYRTDTHWRQENLHDVVVSLSDAMGAGGRISHEYTENVLEGFKGVYHGQSALSPEPDRLIYLTNDVLDACTVYDY